MSRPEHFEEGVDEHADKRDRDRKKKLHGHQESGRSVKLLQSIIGKRANGDLPPTSGKRRKRKRKRA